MKYGRFLKKKRTVEAFVALAFFLFAGIFASRVASAQDISPSLYSEMKWRMIGPFPAGKVNGVVGVPGNPAIYYMGADGGGVWKTTDGDVTYGNGVYKSTNGGETWRHLGLEDTRHIARILVDPWNPDIVLIAALGHSYGPNEERGVFRSTDGGNTWKKVLFKDNTTGAVDLCFEPGNPKVVYATLWHVLWKPKVKDQSFEPGSGLYKSKDGGITWTQNTGNGLPTVNWARAGSAFT